MKEKLLEIAARCLRWLILRCLPSRRKKRQLEIAANRIHLLKEASDLKALPDQRGQSIRTAESFLHDVSEAPDGRFPHKKAKKTCG